ncbi:PAS domain-containing protein [Coleofasciculus sp. FACHB-1120]|uniref:PAS domain-containing sensor histidine kinase n=1 Tax=Coleofasciculus sp. FACHB-1120 TaxID=2692783 RepID=UPI001688C118|nr:PAS domain-containing protein [Coleofasciculus sp. FACHB-1120]MBD2741393.1 PAS domain-containing protein [Coleofasciculus sp. FACHB-1120]
MIKKTGFLELLQSYSKKAGIIVTVIGCVVFLGWILDITALKSILPGLVSMKANTSIAFILGGLSLCLWHDAEHKRQNAKDKRRKSSFDLSQVLAIIVILISLLTLIEYGFGWNVGIDELLFKDPAGAVGTSAPGRMSPNSALSFLMLGSALWLLSKKVYRLAHCISLGGFLIGFLGLLGYIYGITSLYGKSYNTGVALHTAIAFILLSTGVLFACPDRGLMTVVTSDKAGGLMVRRMSPAAIGIPSVLGWFILCGYQSQIYDSELGLALFGVFNVVIFAFLIWWNARFLNAVDSQRHRAEAALKQVNQELEDRVEERTIELSQLNKQLHQRIAEHQETEEALQVSYNLLNAVIEGTTDIIFIKDLQGRYLMVNSIGAKILGKSVEEMIGKDDSQVFPEVAPQLMETDRRIMASGTTQTLEEIVYINDIAVTYLSTKNIYRDPQGNVIGLIGMSRDISDRRALEKELARREQLLNSFINVAPVGLCILDDQMRYLQINEALAHFNGVSVEEHLGRSLAEVLPDAAQVIESTLRKVLTTGEAILNMETCGELPGNPGVLMHWLTSQFPIPGEDGKPMALGATVMDITARKQAEEARQEKEVQLKEKNQQLEHTLQELQRTQGQLIQSEKMSSLGQLVAGIAHEINNPVNFIFGNLTHVREYTQDLLNLLRLYHQQYPNSTPEIQEEIEAIDLDFMMEDFPNLLSSMKVGADRIREIVLSLRNFSRIDEAEMKAVDIHEGIDSTLMILHNRLKAKPDHPNIQIIKEYGHLPKVECYAGQLNQVFMNLIANAIDASDEYNKQRSLSEIKANPSWIKIRTEVLDCDRVVIKIADNGSGMTEAVRQQLFNPFFTTKAIGKGTGLGLAISYQIVVEKHNGQLQCLSAPGGGAEFIIEIPLRQMV